MNLFILLAFIGLTLAPFAFGADTYPMNDAERGGKFQIEIISKQACISNLQRTLYPEKVIAEGINSLKELSFDTKEMLPCLKEILGSWNKEFAAELKNSYFHNSSQAKTDFNAAKHEMQMKINCLNPYPNGSSNFNAYEKNYPHCAGNWVTKEEQAEISKKLDELYKEGMLLRSISESLYKASMQESTEKLRKLEAELNCRNPYENEPDSHSSKTYRKNNPSCEGKWLSAADALALKENIKKANDELWAQMSMHGKEKNIVQKLSYDLDTGGPTDFIYEKRNILLPLLRKLNCWNPHTDDQYMSNNWKNNMGKSCAQFTDASELPSLVAEIRAELGDLQTATVKAEETKKKREEERQRLLTLAAEPKARLYTQRRLMAQLHAYLLNGGAPDKLDAFCEGYERAQHRDKKLVESKYGKGDVSTAMFNDSYWNYAEKHGFTEGEMAALNAYIGNFYKTVNPMLYGGSTRDPEIEVYKETLDAALDKLPTYSGPPLKRHTTLPHATAEKHELGSIIKYEAYTSTTKKKNWGWGGKHQFLVYPGKNAKDVSEINSSEEEVIFKAGTSFKVIGKEKGTSSGYGEVTNYVLAEVDEDGKVIATLPADAATKAP